MGIDKDDPQLRDVLSQRLEGGSRGRRRRGPFHDAQLVDGPTLGEDASGGNRKEHGFEDNRRAGDHIHSTRVLSTETQAYEANDLTNPPSDGPTASLNTKLLEGQSRSPEPTVSDTSRSLYEYPTVSVPPPSNSEATSRVLQVTASSTERSVRRKVELFWYCCSCSDGPLGYEINVLCCQCHHARCDGCELMEGL